MDSKCTITVTNFIMIVQIWCYKFPFFQVHQSDLSQCVPPVNGFTYTVYDSSNSLTVVEGTKLYNQTTLTISDIEQGVTYVITIIAVNDVGEGESAMVTISELCINKCFPFGGLCSFCLLITYVNVHSFHMYSFCKQCFYGTYDLIFALRSLE